MHLTSHHRISQRRACALLRHPRSTHHYGSVKDPQLALRERMHEIAQVRVLYGYRRIHVLHICRSSDRLPGQRPDQRRV